MFDKPIKFSVSQRFVDKTPSDTKLSYSEGFEPYELTILTLADAVDRGWTFSYQFLYGKRSVANFQATDFLAIDVDYGMRTEEALSHPIVEKYCSMFYTTANHTPENHRFRLVFILPKTITSANDLSAANRALAQRLGGDKASTDAARMFHGCKDSNPEVWERSIDDVFLNELIEDGRQIPVSESISFDASTTSRSLYRPEHTLMVRTAKGHQVKATLIKTTTSIHCPFHNDENPSAFVSRNKRGSIYIHCPKCQKTWWITEGEPHRAGFNDFESKVVGLTQSELSRGERADVSSIIENAELMRPENVYVMNTRHLDIRELRDGLTLIKSPKGSGKTTFLEEALTGILPKKSAMLMFDSLEGLEENDEPDDYYSDEKVLLIGHRQALIGELCQRLDLNSYLDDRNKSYSQIETRRNRYGVCLDSLWKIKDRAYDIVVIDEVEQVLSHFFSETVGEKRYGIFSIFSKLIRNAKQVVALDADLGWATFTTLTDLIRSADLPKSNKRKSPKNDPNRHVDIYINQFKQSGKTIQVHPNISQLIHRIKQDVVKGARIFITSNSKKKIKALDASLQKFENVLGREIDRIVITSDNSTNTDIQAFIKNIKSACLEHQVIMSSPSLGTGVDISFSNDKQEIDAVYGLFENQINSHFEVDQQLARVRNPKEVHVWVSPACFNFETEFEVVKHDYLRRNLLDSVIDGFQPFNPSANDEFGSFLKLAALVISQQRASKNFLKSNFIRYRQQQGWDVSELPVDDEMRKEGRDFFKAGKDIAKEEHVQALLVARVLNKNEFDVVEEKLEDEQSSIAIEEWMAYLRTKLELFYRHSISRDLIKLDQDGKFRRAVSMYEMFSQIGEQTYVDYMGTRSNERDKKLTKKFLKLFRDRSAQAVMIHTLLSTTPLFKNGVFNESLVFTKDDLKKFVKASLELKPLVETQFQITTQKDVHIKPTQHLNKILKLIGLHADSVETKSKNKGKETTYRFGSDHKKRIDAIVERRQQFGREGWDFVDQTYGFTYPEYEEIPEILLSSFTTKTRKKWVDTNGFS
jgi:hypothetical protein